MKKWLLALVILALVLPVATPAFADTIYVVQRGDTLYRIAARHGVSVSAIVAANGITNPNRIYVGQRLVIPIPGGGSTPQPPAGGITYVVQRGDTLWALSRRWNTTVEVIRSVNGLTSNIIYIGQVLTVPGTSPASGAPAPTPTTPRPPLQCAHDWFFPNGPADACPATPPIRTNAAAERFEHGLMIWLGHSDTIYVLHERAPRAPGRLGVYPGPLRVLPGGSPNNRVGGAPPGFYEPVSGFGLLWRGEVVNVEMLRTQLGWALEPEYGYQATFQCAAHPYTNVAIPSCYLRLPDGQLVYFYHLRFFDDYWQPYP